MNKSKAKCAGPSLLVADDDEATRVSYAAALVGAGYQVIQAGDGSEVLALVEQEKPAVVLLDVDMPHLDGWQTLAQLRRIASGPRVVMLTGLTQVDDRVRGLTAGADDYLCKPCDLRELLARVHTVLRRTAGVSTGLTLLHFGPTTVDVRNRTAFRAGQATELTRTEYLLLEVFARYPGELVTRERLLELVWGYTRQSNTRTVDTHIWRLRQKLADESRWIQTVPAGSGYRMVCDQPAA